MATDRARERRGRRRGRFRGSVEKILFASLAIAPLTIGLHYLADLPETTEFVLSALALIPLAWLIGEATELPPSTRAGDRRLLNATFRNAPELIIALIAVHEGLTEVVRGSLTGSVVSNLLRARRIARGGRARALDRFSSFLSLGLIAFATALFLIPSIPGWDGDPDTHSSLSSRPRSPSSCSSSTSVPPGTRCGDIIRHVASDEEISGWSLRSALGVLAVATVVTALVAEILVGSPWRCSP